MKEVQLLTGMVSFVGEKITTMFEVTIRTDNQAALEELLGFLKVLDLKIIKLPKASNAKKAIEVKVEMPTEASTPPPKESKEKKIVKWCGMDVDITDVKTGFGCLKGMIHLTPDWDEPLEDFKEYM